MPRTFADALHELDALVTATPMPPDSYPSAKDALGATVRLGGTTTVHFGMRSAGVTVTIHPDETAARRMRATTNHPALLRLGDELKAAIALATFRR